MNKTMLGNYPFNAAARTLDLSAIPGFDFRQLRYVHNLSTHQDMYVLGDAVLTAEVEAGVLSLALTTTGMQDDDLLEIIYDDQTDTTATTLGQINTAVGNVQAAINAVTSAVNVVAAAMAMGNSSAASIAANTSSLTAALASLQALAGTGNAALGTLHGDGLDLQALVNTGNAALATLHADVTAGTTAVVSAINTVASAVAAVNSTLGAGNASLGSLVSQTSSLASALSALQTLVATGNTGLSALQVDVQAIQALITTGNAALATLHADVANGTASIVSAVNAVASSLADVATAVNTGNASSATIASQTASLTAALANLQTLAATGNTALADLHTDLGSINTLITAGNSALAAIQASAAAGATAAAQATAQTSLSAMQTALAAIQTSVAGSATAANQVTAQASLTAMQAALAAIQSSAAAGATAAGQSTALAALNALHSDLTSTCTKLDTIAANVTALGGGKTVADVVTALNPLATDVDLNAMSTALQALENSELGKLTSMDSKLGGTLSTKITDGTNSMVVKAGSTLPSASDPAGVVTVRDTVTTTPLNSVIASYSQAFTAPGQTMTEAVPAGANFVEISLAGTAGLSFSVATTLANGSTYNLTLYQRSTGGSTRTIIVTTSTFVTAIPNGASSVTLTSFGSASSMTATMTFITNTAIPPGALLGLQTDTVRAMVGVSACRWTQQSTANLAAGATFTGSWQDMFNAVTGSIGGGAAYPQEYRVFATSDKTCTLYRDVSPDGSTAYPLDTTVGAIPTDATNYVCNPPPYRPAVRQCRARFKNTSGSTSTSLFISDAQVAA